MSQASQMLLVAFETEQSVIAQEIEEEYWTSSEYSDYCNCSACSGYDDYYYPDYDPYYDGDFGVEVLEGTDFDAIQDRLEGIRWRA